MASLPLRLVSLRRSGHHVVHYSMMDRYNPACIVRGIAEDLHRNISTANYRPVGGGTAGVVGGADALGLPELEPGQHFHHGMH